MGTDQRAAVLHVLDFAVAAMTRHDWKGAHAWCAVAWMIADGSTIEDDPAGG